jgi:hypothetical protein
VTVAACLAVLAVAFLPWVRSGRVDRHAFAVARTARNLGVVDTGAERALLLTYVLMPMLVAGAWLAAALARRRLLAVLAAVIGVVAIAAGIVVLSSPVRTGPGAWASIVAGSVALAGAAWLVLVERHTHGG